MAIQEKDIKLLWGRSAGICSNPDCREKLSVFDQNGESFLTGEMAHIVAKNIGGPRADTSMGADAYDNLILLCPTCHTKVDKAPSDYPIPCLVGWKELHENWVDQSLAAPHFKNSEGMLAQIDQMLSENFHYFIEYGPKSKRAQENPGSSIYSIWLARRLDVIIQNNRRIVNILEANPHFVDPDLRNQARLFRDHALAYEQNVYGRLEDYPTFPTSFGDLIKRRVRK